MAQFSKPAIKAASGPSAHERFQQSNSEYVRQVKAQALAREQAAEAKKREKKLKECQANPDAPGCAEILGTPRLKPKPVRNPIKQVVLGAVEAVKGAADKIENEVEWGAKVARAAVTGESTEEVSRKVDRFREVVKEQETKGVAGAFTGARRIAQDAAEQVGRGIADVGGMAVDAAVQGTAAVFKQPIAPEDNPFDPSYQGWGDSLDVFEEPESGAGKLAATVLSFVGVGSSISRQLPRARTVAGAIGRDAAAGGLADFLLTQKGDGNLGSALEEFFPGIEDSPLGFLTALAIDEDDNLLETKLKATAEGGPLGVGLDLTARTIARAANKAGFPKLASGIAGLMEGRKVTQKALKEGKAPEAAIEEGLKAGTEQAHKVAEAQFQANFRTYFDDAIKRDRELARLKAERAKLTKMTTPDGSPDPWGDGSAPKMTAKDAERAKAIDTKIGEMETAKSKAKASGDQLRSEDAWKPSDEQLNALIKKRDELSARGTTGDDPLTPEEIRVLEGLEKQIKGLEAKPKESPTAKRVEALDKKITQLEAEQARPRTRYAEDALQPEDRAGDFLGPSREELKDPNNMRPLTDPQNSLLANASDNPEGVAKILDEVENAMDVDTSKQADLAMIEQLEADFADMSLKYDLTTMPVDQLIKGDRRFMDVTGSLTDRGAMLTRRLLVQNAESAFEASERFLKSDEKGRVFGTAPQQMVDNMINLVTLVEAIGKKSGRGLRTLGLPLNKESLSERVLQVTDDPVMKQAADRLRKLAEDIQMGDEKSKANAVKQLRYLAGTLAMAEGSPKELIPIRSLIMQDYAKNAYTVFIQSLFSAPATLFRASAGAVIPFADNVGLALNGVFTGDTSKVRAGMAAFTVLHSSVVEGLSTAKRIMKFGVKEAKFSGDQKYSYRAIQNRKQMVNNIKLAPDFPAKALAQTNLWTFDLLQKIGLDYNMRGLTALDEIATTYGYRAHLRATAMLKAAREANATGGSIAEMLVKYEKEFDSEWLDVSGRLKDPQVLQHIRKKLYQGEAVGLTRALNTFLSSDPTHILKRFLPVVNMASQNLAHTRDLFPGLNQFNGRAAQLIRKEAELGLNESEIIELADIRGRQAFGGLLMTATAMMVAAMGEDNFTGFGPKRGSPEFKAWEMAGKTPMSVRINGKWYSYAHLQPFSTAIAAVAEAPRLRDVLGEDGAGSILGHAAFTVAQASTGPVFAQGFRDLTALFEADNPKRMEQILLGLVNNQMPYGSLRRAVTNAFEPYAREYRSGVERLVDQAFMGTKANPFKGPHPESGIEYNLMTGEPVANIRSGVVGFFTGGIVSRDTSDPTVRRMAEEGFNFNREMNQVQHVKLTGKMMSQLQQKMIELGYRDRMEEVVWSDEFDRRKAVFDEMPEKEKAERRNLELSETSDTGSPHYLLRTTHNKIKQEAVQVLIAEDTEWAEKVAAVQEARVLAPAAQPKTSGRPRRVALTPENFSELMR